jgi:hypothetical protein
MSPHARIWPWYLLAAVGFALALLGQLGKEWGWWNDIEAIATWAGLALGVYGAATAASERTVRRLEVPLERLADDLATIKLVLERIERLLTERLPPR